MKHLVLSASILIACAGVSAEELLFNSKFALGTDGFYATRFIRPDTNPKLIYDPLKVEKTDGVSALRIDNRFCERIELVGEEMKLQPGTKYRLSLKMKSSVPVRINATVIGNHVTEGWDSTFRKCKVEPEFRTFSFNFTTKKKPIGFYTPCIQMICDQPATLWIAQWSIRKIDDASPEKVEISASTEKSYYVQKTDGKRSIPVKISAYNPTGKSVKFRMDLNVLESRAGNWPDQKFLQADRIDCGEWEIPAGKTVRKEVTVPTPRYGAFMLQPEAADMKTFSKGSRFAVLGDYQPQELDLDRDACVGINGGIIGLPPYYRFRKPSFMALGMSPEEMMQCYAAQGVRLFRFWGFPSPFSWYELEPEKGKFNFKPFDLLLDLTTRNKIYPLPVLGQNDFCTSHNTKRKSFYGLPDWLIPLCTKKLAARQKDFSKLALYLPPMNEWKRFITEVVRHAGDRVTHYEIMNEPHLQFGEPAEYVPYLKGAYEAIKAVDPKKKVVGFCATSDLGARMEAFYVPCFKAGGLDYADIVSFHPYQNPKLSSLQPADETVRSIHEMIKPYSDKKYPLWNTELYYLRGDTGVETLKYLSSACDLTQRMLTDLGEGVGQSISLEWQQILFKSSPHFRTSDGICGRFTPNSFGVTCNMFARFLEGAKPAGKIRWANDSICYLYQRRDGSYAAAFWHFGSMSGLNIDLNCKPGEGTLIDLFGNPIKDQNTVALDENPKVLLWKGSLADLESKMKSVKISAACPVTVVADARILPLSGGGSALAVNIRNITALKVDGMAGCAAALNAVPVELEPFSEKNVMIPLFKEVSGKIQLKILTGGRLTVFPVETVPMGKTAFCGKTYSAETVMRGKGPLKNSWKVIREDGNLKFEITVDDPAASEKNATRKPWEQDCVELFFDTMPENIHSKHSSNYNGDVFRLFLMPEGKDQCRMTAMPADSPVAKEVKVTSLRDGKGYKITVQLPEKLMFGTVPPKGKLLGFELKIDNADGSGPVTNEVEWNGGKEPFISRFQFGIIVLE